MGEDQKIVCRYDSDLNLVEAVLRQDKKTGLFYREDTSDLSMIRDCSKNYNALLERLQESDILMDAGANVGAFSALAAPKVKLVVAYEPVSSTLDVTHLNVGTTQNVLIKEGALSNCEGFTTFKMNRGKANACSGRIVKKSEAVRKGKLITVPTFSFEDEVHKYEVTALKIDIEGGEYDVLRNIPAQIRIIGGELHGMRKKDKEKMDTLIVQLKYDGWKFLFEEYEMVFGEPRLYNFVCERT